MTSLQLSAVAVDVDDEHSMPRFRSTTAVAALAMLVSYLPFSGTNALLGRIHATTGAPTSSLQWVTGAFTVALASSILVGGSLAERFGRRLTTQLALVVTAAGCVLGWLAGAVGTTAAAAVLTLALAVAGIGGGLVMSASLSLIAATAPTPAVRARAIAVWAAANVVGLGVGPFLAWATESVTSGAASWRWLFAPITCLAVVGAVALRLAAIEPDVDRSRSVDLRGQALAALGIASLVYGVIGAADPARPALTTAGALVVGVAALTSFLLLQSRVDAPVLPPSLFRRARFTAACLASMTALFTVVGLVFVLSLTLATQGATPLQIATTTGVLFAGNAIASIAAGGWQRHVSAYALTLAGLVLSALALVTLTRADLAGPSVALDVLLFVLGLGVGTTIATSTSLAVQSVPGPLAPTAGTASSALRQVGAALGGAVIGGVFAHGAASGTGAADAAQACVAVLLVVVLVASIAVRALGRRESPAP